MTVELSGVQSVNGQGTAESISDFASAGRNL
jgi:hypothetical protein